MMKRTHKTLFCAASVVVFCLNPLESSAVLRIRTDGTGCTVGNPSQGITLAHANSGLSLMQATAGARGIACPIPLGPDLVDLGDGNGHPLEAVNARFHQTSSASVMTELIVHDYDSTDFCTCGVTNSSSSGYFFRAMTFDCGACAYSTSWAAGVEVTNQNSPGNILQLKLVSIYDTN